MSLLMKKEPTLEYERVNPKKSGIEICYNKPYLSLSVEKDTWVFPWTTLIPLNAKGLFLPDDTIVLIESVRQDIKIEMCTMTQTLYQLTVRGRLKRLFPKKIYAGETVARMVLVKTIESHVVDYHSE